MSLLEQLNLHTLEKGLLIRAICELTYACNLHCVHCYCVDSGLRRELSTEEWKRVLGELAAEGVLSLTLTGGEVLSRRDFFELAEHARRLRFALRIFTNGTLVDEAAAERLRELAPTSVEVSVYGASAETGRQVTGQAWAWDRVREGIRRLRRRDVRVVAKVPVLRQNHQEHARIRAFCRDLGVEVVAATSVTMRDDGCWAPLGHRMDASDEIAFHAEWTDPVRPREPDPVDHLCAAGKNTLVVTPYGDLFPCVQLKVAAGNVRERSIRQVWRTSPWLARVRAIRRGDLPACQECEHQAYCRPCVGLAWAETGQLTTPSRLDCRRFPLFQTAGILAPVSPQEAESAPEMEKKPRKKYSPPVIEQERRVEALAALCGPGVAGNKQSPGASDGAGGVCQTLNT